MKQLLILLLPFFISCNTEKLKVHEIEHSDDSVTADSVHIIVDDPAPILEPKHIESSRSEQSTKRVTSKKIKKNFESDEHIVRQAPHYPGYLSLYPEGKWYLYDDDAKRKYLIDSRISLELGHGYSYLSNGMRGNELPDEVEFTIRYLNDAKVEVSERYKVVRLTKERYTKVSDSDGVCGPMYKALDPRNFEFSVSVVHD